MTHPVVLKIARRIRDRSQSSRDAYLQECALGATRPTSRAHLGCTNLAHSYAAATPDEKILLRHTEITPNLGIVTAYNDMLSAHQPYGRYPDFLKSAALEFGATAQVAGGVPAMCDGVTQGQPGMELSLFSRDTIALSTAIALSHHVFDGALYLGICDKIVPGLLIGALSFGFLPGLFVPSGPMHSGLSNEEKARVRVAYEEGKVGHDTLLQSEEASYHSSGTCTFYGTANSNQMLLEMMGLQLPGSSFVPPHSELRQQLTRETVRILVEQSKKSGTGIGELLEAENIVNAIIGLLTTGGSTNHTLHIPAIARAAGWIVDWNDFAELSDVIPLLARLYPNGAADVNHYHQQDGTPAVIKTLLQHGLLFPDIRTAYGLPFSSATHFPEPGDKAVTWREARPPNPESTLLRPVEKPFSASSGLRVLSGNLGRSILKVSALPAHLPHVMQLPARVFHSQEELQAAFKTGELTGNFIAVLPGQGPSANGMPELHKLTPALTSLQNQGLQVALLTDGRMSGASGKFPAAIHITPEAIHGGLIGKIRDGDLIELDWKTGRMELHVAAAELAQRTDFILPPQTNTLGRRLFASARATVTAAEQGASFILRDLP
ncbi:MAG TPA: phosphogluconate dehydratase [Candidatus Kapabacteria bacterium]|nr:phosphogluconate dehydratase [Candidatus Kapabacteria bacterium]